MSNTLETEISNQSSQLRLVLANYSQVEQCFNIIKQAKTYQQQQNNYQWDENYPSFDHILDDINKKQCFVVLNEQDQIVLTVALIPKKHDYYSVLYKKNIRVLTISRLGLDTAFIGKGYAKKSMELIEQYANDNQFHFLNGYTSSLNFQMQNLFLKMGYFKYNIEPNLEISYQSFVWYGYMKKLTHFFETF